MARVDALDQKLRTMVPGVLPENVLGGCDRQEIFYAQQGWQFRSTV
jgi:hypothetical protein